MKKMLLVPIILAVLTANAYSVTMDIGLHGGGAWWAPYFHEWVSGDHALSPFVITGAHNYSIDPTWHIGPELGFRFTEKIRWRNTYTYSRFNAEASYLLVLFFSSLRYYKPAQKIEKHSLDSTVDYSVHKNVSILAGFKYQNYTDKMKDYGISSTSLSGSSWESVWNGLGFGVGAGVRFDLIKDLSVNLDARFIYIKPLLKIKRDGYYASVPYILYSEFKPNYHSLGMEADLSLAYFIKQASLTIALGCKYQFLQILGHDTNGSFIDKLYYNNAWPKLANHPDHQIELYLSAVYHLKLPG